MKEKYASILYRAHPEPKKHKRMSAVDRAAQFGSFAALTGHSDMIKEEGRFVDVKVTLNEEQMFDLNDNLKFICDNIESIPECNVTYFVPDEKKSGGVYISKKVKIRKIDLVNRVIVATDKTKILIDDIYSIDRCN